MSGSTPATLRRTWHTSSAQLVAIIIGLGVLAIFATSHLKSEFHHTTSHVESEMTSITLLKAALVEVSVTATPVMYGFDGTTTADDNMAAYLAASHTLTATFDAAGEVFVEPEPGAVLAGMRDRWTAVDANVRAAPELLAAGALDDLATSGADPFAELVWQPFNEIDLALLDLQAHSVGQLGDRITGFDRMHTTIVVLVVVAVVLALLMSAVAAHRISRRVLRPLSALRQTVLAVRNDRLDVPIEFPDDAAVELHDLSRALGETYDSLRASHELLVVRAGTDALTELPNRRAFLELLEDLLAEEGADRIGVLFIDLDDFKVVNDSLGHAAGDELLRVVTRRLRSVTRHGETIARLGGDEFAIVLRSDSVSSAALATAERALAALEDRVVIEGTNVALACSIGVAVSPEGAGADVADELLRNADFAMYMAKSQGKNRIEVFAPTMHAEIVARMELKHGLGQATGLGQFVLDYQPIVDIGSRSLLGFEALIRWNHPTRGLLPPIEFIPLAEDTGDIVAIGQWVLDEACRALANHHRAQDPDESPLWMSVNVSPVEILRRGFVADVIDTLERHGVLPRSLMIEITEGVAITDTGTAAAVLDDLRATGVHIALDDFGTGFSSLRSLHELPIDVIKIDRSFLVDAHPGSDAETLLEMIVALGSTLGLHVIAEGVETIDDLDRLERFHIAGQGYLFARPLSSADADEFRAQASTPVPAAV